MNWVQISEWLYGLKWVNSSHFMCFRYGYSFFPKPGTLPKFGYIAVPYSGSQILYFPIPILGISKKKKPTNNDRFSGKQGLAPLFEQFQKTSLQSDLVTGAALTPKLLRCSVSFRGVCLKVKLQMISVKITIILRIRQRRFLFLFMYSKQKLCFKNKR